MIADSQSVGEKSGAEKDDGEVGAGLKAAIPSGVETV